MSAKKLPNSISKKTCGKQVSKDEEPAHNPCLLVNAPIEIVADAINHLSALSVNGKMSKKTYICHAWLTENLKSHSYFFLHSGKTGAENSSSNRKWAFIIKEVSLWLCSLK